MIALLKIALVLVICFGFVFLVLMSIYWLARRSWKRSGKPLSYEEDIETHEK